MLLFDHNATSPLCATAREAWLRATEEFPGNPSSQHRLGKRAERALEEAREKLAGILGCAAHEIVWTSGATEAANTVFQHVAAESGGEAWVSAIEHPCVLESARRWFAGRFRLIPVQRDGQVEARWLEEALASGPSPALVAMMAANNETGVLQPWHEAFMLCQGRGTQFFCDAAQWVGKLPAAGLGACTFVSGCGHKFGGPGGVGFLKVRGALRPLLLGGPQEDGRRAGTENLPGILAMLAALEVRERTSSEERTRWRQEFEAALQKAVPGAEIVGEGSARLWNTTSAILPAPDCRTRWVVKLDKAGVAASTGSACSSGQEKTSHVLSAMGLTPEQARRVVRFSSGWETTAEEWVQLLSKIKHVSDSLMKEAAVV